MSVHLSEEEQIEALKRWWKQYGTTTVIAIAVVGWSFFGWNYYKQAKIDAAQKASVQFEGFSASVEKLNGLAKDAKDQDMHLETVKKSAEAIIQEQSQGLYTDLARLQLAKMAMEKQELDKAAEFLALVKSKGSNQESKSMATIRLARVYAAQAKYDDALATLGQSDSNGAYKSLVEETKGDIYSMQNKLDQASAAYQSAMESMGEMEEQAASRFDRLRGVKALYRSPTLRMGSRGGVNVEDLAPKVARKPEKLHPARPHEHLAERPWKRVTT